MGKVFFDVGMSLDGFIAGTHGRWVGGATPAIGLVRAVKVFVPLWFIAAGINMWVGVSKAGYSVEFIDYTQVDANVELAPR